MDEFAQLSNACALRLGVPVARARDEKERAFDQAHQAWRELARGRVVKVVVVKVVVVAELFSIMMMMMIMSAPRF